MKAFKIKVRIAFALLIICFGVMVAPISPETEATIFKVLIVPLFIGLVISAIMFRDGLKDSEDE